MKKIHYYCIFEDLPWLENPRIIDSFDSLEKARQECKDLNRKSCDSNFFVGEIGYVYWFEMMAPPKPLGLPISWD